MCKAYSQLLLLVLTKPSIFHQVSENIETLIIETKCPSQFLRQLSEAVHLGFCDFDSEVEL